jgi:hypothetical protein
MKHEDAEAVVGSGGILNGKNPSVRAALSTISPTLLSALETYIKSRGTIRTQNTIDTYLRIVATDLLQLREEAEAADEREDDLVSQ